jgi:hypothetical protein
LGPLRSRLLLWALTSIACVLAVGTIAGYILGLLFAQGKPPMGLLLGPAVFGGFAAVGFHELRKTRPLTQVPEVTAGARGSVASSVDPPVAKTAEVTPSARAEPPSSARPLAQDPQDDKVLCYLCGKPLAEKDRQLRVCQACRA